MKNPTLRELMAVECWVEFRPIARFAGTCRYADSRVVIDLRKRHNIAKVFLHELIHISRKDWPERRVLRMEYHLWKTLTHEEVELLYRKMYRDNAKGGFR